jgi:hypothetical protein
MSFARTARRQAIRRDSMPIHAAPTRMTHARRNDPRLASLIALYKRDPARVLELLEIARQRRTTRGRFIRAWVWCAEWVNLARSLAAWTFRRLRAALRPPAKDAPPGFPGPHFMP